MSQLNLLPHRLSAHRQGGFFQSLRPTERAEHVVGLYFDGDGIGAAYVVHGVTDEPMLLRLAHCELPPESILDGDIRNPTAMIKELQGLREELEAAGLPRNARTAFLVAGHSVIVKSIALPKMTDEELWASLMWEAEQYIPFNLDDVCYSWEPSRSGQNHREMLLAAARTRMVEDYAQQVVAAGFGLSVVEPQVMAMQRLVKRTSVPGIHIHIGSDLTCVVIVDETGHIAFSRDIGLGEKDLLDEIVKQTSTSYQDALDVWMDLRRTSIPASANPSNAERAIQDVFDRIVLEIGRSVDFYTTTHEMVSSEVGEVLVSGRLSGHPMLKRDIESAFQQGVIELKDNISIAPKADVRNSDVFQRFAPAVGLAFRTDWGTYAFSGSESAHPRKARKGLKRSLVDGLRRFADFIERL